MSGSPHDFAADAFHAGQLYRSCFRELTESCGFTPNEMFVLLFLYRNAPEQDTLQCTPASPNCMFCPFVDTCVARQKGVVDTLPVKQHKTKVANRYFNYIYVRMGAHTLINKRTGNDIWKNLYELPLIETENEVPEEKFYALSRWREMLAEGETPLVRLVQKGVKHVLSHRVIYANFYEVILPEDSASFAQYQRIRIEDLHKFAVSRLVNQFFSLILKPDN